MQLRAYLQTVSVNGQTYNNNDDDDDDDDNNNNDSKSFRKYVSNIPGNHEVRELQKTAILGTAHILQKVLT
jgi:hypothetical protein